MSFKTVVKELCVGFSLLLVGLVSNQVFAQSVSQIYVHTDRDIYFPGDRVWFKAYVLRDGKLDPTIKNIYMDWADENGKIIKSMICLAAEGVSPSTFDIPMNYSSNQLQMNVYTLSMANNKEFGYYRNLAVAQKEAQIKNLSHSSKSAVGIQPEVLELESVDSTKLVLHIPSGKFGSSVSIVGRINHSELFSRKMDLQSNKPNRLVLPIADLEAGLLQIRLSDSTGKIVANAVELINITKQVLKPKVTVSGQNLKVTLPDDDIASLSLSVVQEELPADTVHHIVNDLLFGTLVKDVFPTSIATPATELATYQMNWDPIAGVLGGATTEEEVLSLTGNVTMSDKAKKKFLSELRKLKINKIKIRGVSFGSQADNEPSMSYKLLPIQEDLSLKLPSMIFFGDLELKTMFADPELNVIPFETNYSFGKLKKPEKIYRPDWEDFSVSNSLQKKWLPIFEDYQKVLLNSIDTVTIRQSASARLAAKYDPGQSLGAGVSEIINVQLDAHVKKYPTPFSDYLQTFQTKNGGVSRDPKRIAFFLNRQQVSYEEVSNMDMFNFAYIRVFYDPNTIPGMRPGDYRAAIQLVEIPPSERRKTFSVEEKIEGYAEVRTFDQVGKMTLWWDPFVVISDATRSKILSLPFLPKGKRVNIQGVTQSGKLVYFSEIIQ